jgi:hypothetical protein
LALVVVFAGAHASADPSEAQPQPQTVSVDAEARAARAAASEALAVMETTAARVRTLLRRARTQGQKAEIACVDEALSRADVATRRARDDAKAAQEAFARADVIEARRAGDRVTRAREMVRRVAATADACFVDDRASATGTQVRVVVDPTLPPDAATYASK